MKVWTGSAWTAEKPVKYWNGSTWTAKPVKYWDGTQWVQKPSSALWTPIDLGSDLLAWFDASNASTVIITGSGVSQWINNGVSSYTLTQNIDTSRPSYASNAISFTGFQWLKGTNSPLEYDFFVVAKPRFSTSDWCSLFITLDDSNVIATIPDSGTDPAAIAFGVYCGGWGQAGTLTWPSQDGFAYGTLKAGFPVKLSRDGSPLMSTGLGPVSSQTGVYGFGSSASYGGGGYISQAFGTIYEFILVPFNSSNDIKQKLEGYAAWKRGLQGLLPSGHPYKTAAPTK